MWNGYDEDINIRGFTQTFPYPLLFFPVQTSWKRHKFGPLPLTVAPNCNESWRLSPLAKKQIVNLFVSKIWDRQAEDIDHHLET